MLVATVFVSALLAAALTAQSYLILEERKRAEETRQSVDKEELYLRKSTAEQTKFDLVLRQAQNSEVLDRNVFLNTLISRKAVSWTQLFADLEKIMPGTVRLVSVRPQITPNNQVILDMTVGAMTGEPVVDMLMRLEGSPLFGATTITTLLPPSQNETLYRYRLSVNYAPKP